MRALALAVLLGASAAAHAQEAAPQPQARRLAVGGEMTLTVAPEDPGFFNYTDYEFNALRNVRLGLAASVRAAQRVQVLGEVRFDHGDTLRAYAVFVRVRPWTGHRIDLLAGRLPPTFGAFAPLAYGQGNVLVGTPLAYQYLTSVRPDAIPATREDLLRMRGRGWLTSFPLGDSRPRPGVPLVNLSRRDTGLQAHAVLGGWNLTGSITTGSLSNPRVDDDNGGRQLAARATWQVTPLLRVGGSAARGAFLSREVRGALPEGRVLEGYRQEAAAADVEYARDRWLVRGEIVYVRWALPLGGAGGAPLWLPATAWWIEGRYRVVPGVDLAARGERLTFGRIAVGDRLRRWEAPVDRLEGGATWRVHRHVAVKGAWQRNRRDGGRVRHDTFAAAQLLLWF